jgi:glycosyltransferase involved in cell wall biosynthesis
MRSCVFTSDFLLRHHCAQNLVPGRGVVLHWGVESSAIPRRPTVRPFAGKFVFAGQLRHDKGVHTAIAAALELRRRGIAGFHLDCYGNSDDTGYVAQLHRTIEEGGLREWVSLRGELSRDVLLSRYSDYDVLVFPSVWDEPFSIGLIEGMAAGLAVLATPTGGTPEILHDGRNALLFPADDALRLADRMTELITDPARVRDLAEAAYRTVVPVFTMDQMAAALSTYLAGEKGGA